MGLNQTPNSFWFQVVFKPNPKPFGVSSFRREGVETKPQTLSGFRGWFKPNPKPLEVLNFRRRCLNQTRNSFGFQTKGLNQTRNPLEFRVSEKGVSTKPETLWGFGSHSKEGVNQTRNSFEFQHRGFVPNLKPLGVSCFREMV